MAVPWSTSVVWVDANGNKTITKVNTVAGLGAVRAAMVASSNADWLDQWESLIAQNGAPAPTAAVFQSVADRAALLFQCADLTTVTLLIPAPTSAAFLPDGETVLSGAPPISTLITALIGVLTNASGSLATAYLAGYRLPRSRTPL